MKDIEIECPNDECDGTLKRFFDSTLEADDQGDGNLSGMLTRCNKCKDTVGILWTYTGVWRRDIG